MMSLETKKAQYLAKWYWAFLKLVGVLGFEPRNGGIKIR